MGLALSDRQTRPTDSVKPPKQNHPMRPIGPTMSEEVGGAHNTRYLYSACYENVFHVKLEKLASFSYGVVQYAISKICSGLVYNLIFDNGTLECPSVEKEGGGEDPILAPCTFIWISLRLDEINTASWHFPVTTAPRTVK